MPSFNLTTEPWITCVPSHGSTPILLSLRDVLVSASEQREILDNSPLVTVAVHRLLLAVLHRILCGPRSESEWRTLMAAGCFDVGKVDAYLQTWRPRFELLDPINPFYQAPLMDVEPKSVSNLAHEHASGNNLTLFDHTVGSANAFTPAQAARYLLSFQVFALGGGVSQPFNLSDGPLARDYTVLVRGASLFETLMFNLIQYTEERPIPWRSNDDPPWWERTTHPEPDKMGTYPAGYLDYLTWQSRRIHLLYDEATGLVRQCQIRQNIKLVDGVQDPFKPYRLSKERGWQSRRFSPNRAVWRDSHSLLEAANEAARRPAIFDWLAATTAAGIAFQRANTQQLDFDVLGALNDGTQATVILWRHEHLPLPEAYLTQRSLRDRLKDALILAEDVSDLFKAYFETIKQGKKEIKIPRPARILAAELLVGMSARSAESEAVKVLVRQFGVERAFWAALEPYFREFMATLPARMNDEASPSGASGADLALADWAKVVRTCAINAFQHLVNSLATNGHALRAVAKAEHQFRLQLGRCLASYRLPDAPQMEVSA